MRPFKTSIDKRLVLGVAAGRQSLLAVLMQDGPSGPTVLDVPAPSTAAGEQVYAPDSAWALPDAFAPDVLPAEEQDGAGDDYTLHFGDGRGGSADLFLSTEFGLAVAPAAAPLPTVPSAPAPQERTADRPSGLEASLNELLDRYRRQGYTGVEVAICLAPADVAYVEVALAGEALRGRSAAARRKLQLAALKAQYEEAFAADRVAFVPMTPAPTGAARFLAVVPRVTGADLSAVCLVDAEVGLYGRLVRDGRPFAEDGTPRTTCVVRVGEEDTLVVVFEGDRLQHVEELTSLTTYDAPERICRRVLLEQDARGIDRLDEIWVLAEAHEEAVAAGFRSFFTEAEVTPLRDRMPSLPAAEPGSGDVLTGVFAYGAALRGLQSDVERHADEVNLRPGRVRPSVPWKLVALVLGMAAVVVVLAVSTFRMEREIDSQGQRVAVLAPAAQGGDDVKARVDSLQGAYMAYTDAVNARDSLLLGSDAWSRALEEVSRHASGVRGLWIESWRPLGNELQVVGNATGRDQVVAFAERLGATVETLSFSEIREWPVYAFSLRIPFTPELPEAAVYLYQQVEAGDKEAPTP